MAAPLWRRTLSAALRLRPPDARGLVGAALLLPVMAALLIVLVSAFGLTPGLSAARPTLAGFADLARIPGLDRAIAVSLIAGLGAGVLSLMAVALFLSGWLGTPLMARLTNLVSPLMAVPHAAAAFGLAFLIAPSGALMRWLSPEWTGFARPPDWLLLNDPFGLALMLGLALKEAPFLFLMSLAALPQLPHADTMRIARSLGRGRVTAFFTSVWPGLYRQIRLPVYAVIAFAGSTIDVAMILGPSSPPPLSVLVLRLMNDPDLSRRTAAAAGALLQLGVTFGALGLWWGLEKAAGRLMRRLALSGLRLTRDGALRWAGLATMLVVLIVQIAGLGLLGFWSVAGFARFPDFWPQTFTLATWAQQTPAILAGLGRASLIAALAALIALALAVWAERPVLAPRPLRRRDDVLLFLPLVTPQIALVGGLSILALWVGLDGSLAGAVAVHVLFVLPYMLLSLRAPFSALDPRYARIGRNLGAGPMRVLFGLHLPMLLAPLLTAFALGFAVSVSQYLPTLLIGAGRWPTITTDAVALAAGGNRQIIGAYASAQTLLIVLPFILALAVPALIWRNRAGLGRGATT